MRSEDIRKRFLAFFKARGHTIIPSASLVPENDPSVLFITAGMQPLVPYLLGQKHPGGARLVGAQKCVRTQDIEEVGDNTHDTFFEMLGNWSLGDPSAPDGVGEAGYFKEETIKWSYEFLTDKKEGLGLDPARLYITVFGGDENAPRDDESVEIWKKVGIPEERIYFQGAEDNWWSPGNNGPCGPDTEIFYDVTKDGLGDMSFEEFKKADDEQKVVELWNDVFMEYEKKDGKIIGKLKQKNVDTGAGIERLAMVMQKTNNVFDTDLFLPLMEKISELSTGTDEKAKRIVADHIRTSVFIIADGVTPSNTDRGYVLRRLLRRAVRYADGLGMKEGTLPPLVDVVIEKYEDVYPGLEQKKEIIKEEVTQEALKFKKTIKKGLKKLYELGTPHFSKKEEGQPPKSFESIVSRGSGKLLFNIFSTYGFPLELSLEEIEKNRAQLKYPTLTIEQLSRIKEEFSGEMKKHQELSRSGAEQKFKGGLADASEMSVKYHTATHLLHKALRDVLGESVEQKGSNITTERLRFDFAHPQKMTDEEKQAVEDLVNKKMKENLPVKMEEMTVAEAREQGALGVFGDKYGEKVKVYSIGDFSKEICGGPHVENTSELGRFKIKKEESVSAGVRRIKAVLK
ncbi:MAG: alanine--tRNA ligase [Patescibacteria group bacterium]|nr:MAG: alanine--tRNA ligase [Patescibacteria group bacterium]